MESNLTNTVQQQEIIDYYRLTKRDIGEYTIPDFIRLLKTEDYKGLDWNVSLAIYSCLKHYRFKYNLYHKTRYISENHYRMQLREFNGNTTEDTVYAFESSAKYPVHRLDDEVYENFFLYYAKHNAPYALKMWEVSYTKVVDNKVIYTLTPRDEYIRLKYILSEVSYWYLGKRLTDNIRQVFTEEFYHVLQQSEYKEMFPNITRQQLQEDGEDTYVKMRNRTRLNKKEVAPVNRRKGR